MNREKNQCLLKDDIVKIADEHFVPCLLVENYAGGALSRVIDIAGRIQWPVGVSATLFVI